jgi:hypothetical protein
MKKYNLAILLLVLVFGISNAQTINVIHIEGDAYTSKMVGEKEIFSKLVYGPLAKSDKIIVKSNSLVRLVGDEKQICELSKEGDYLIKDLAFAKVPCNSIFDKFYDYFHSFFVNHSSSESKANYRNNIYAISRGNTPPPALNFPLAGLIPTDAGSIPFTWSHACDTCEYILTVNDMKSREVIFTVMTKDQKVVMENPKKYLSPDTEYYWTVKTVGVDQEYKNIIFHTASLEAYETRINNLENEIDQSSTPISETARMLYIMSELDAADLQNYALFYGLNLVENTSNSFMKDLFERYYYDSLLAKVK